MTAPPSPSPSSTATATATATSTATATPTATTRTRTRTRTTTTTNTTATEVQRGIERYYRIEETPDVSAFLREARGREAVIVRTAADGVLEIAVQAPPAGPGDLDAACQIIEGVSHFVYLAGRARTDLPATRLELEIQAEVDKYVVLALLRSRFDPARSRALRVLLYERVRFADPPGSARGRRYRMANDLGARVARRLEAEAAGGREARAREIAARFYRMGQVEKIGLARAA